MCASRWYAYRAPDFYKYRRSPYTVADSIFIHRDRPDQDRRINYETIGVPELAYASRVGFPLIASHGV